MTRIREKMCENPELQLLVMDLIAKALVNVKNLNVLCERYQFWEMFVFSKYFYGYGTQGLAPNSNDYKPFIVTNTNVKNEKSQLIAQVRSFAIEIIVYAGAKCELSSLNICEQFLRLIHLFPGDLDQVYLAVRSLVTMLRYNLYNTQMALKRLNALP